MKNVKKRRKNVIEVRFGEAVKDSADVITKQRSESIYCADGGEKSFSYSKELDKRSLHWLIPKIMKEYVKLLTRAILMDTGLVFKLFNSSSSKICKNCLNFSQPIYIAKLKSNYLQTIYDTAKSAVDSDSEYCESFREKTFLSPKKLFTTKCTIDTNAVLIILIKCL